MKKLYMNRWKLLIFICFPILLSFQDDRNEFEILARNYLEQGKMSQAGEFYNKAGYAYWNKGNVSQAADAFQKAYDVFNKLGNIVASITVSNNLGLVYSEQDKFSNAYTAFSNTLALARKTKNTSEIFNALINLGTAAIELGSYPDAISKTTEALSLATELNNLRLIAKCYSLLAESYEKMGDTNNAYKYYESYATIDKKIKSLEMEALKTMSEEEINKANERKRVAEIELKINKGELKLTQDSLSLSERLSLERQLKLEKQGIEMHEKELQLRYERNVARILKIGIAIILIFLGVLAWLFRQKQLDNKLLKLQKEEITDQRNKLDIQNKKITDSIFYGLRIQQAMLPVLSGLEETFDTFIIFKPKDIVSGDFYWYYETKYNTLVYRFIAVADCTGHGVPGAFMSMIGNRLLNEIVGERKIYQPSEILYKLNNSLRKELHHDEKRNLDGMDIALCRLANIGGSDYELVFSGAKRDIVYYSNSSKVANFIEGDHKTIGGIFSGNTKAFSEKHLKITSGDSIVIFSDGIIDQHNAERKRFGTNRFVDALTLEKEIPIGVVKQNLENKYVAYMGNEEQRDDITILGIRIK